MNQSDNRRQAKLIDALRTIDRRSSRPTAWEGGGNLPWNDPVFSARMLAEHLDESHEAASRSSQARSLLLDWLWRALALEPGRRVLDFTCGPGLYATALAQRGCFVTGVDFGPASIAYARELAARLGVADRCTWIEADVRTVKPEPEGYDAALFLYGQLAVFPRADAAALLATLARSLKVGGRLVIELLDQTKIDKRESTWWFTDETGLWGDAPFLHLGERFWDAEAALAIERFTTLHLETGKLDEVILCDQSYAVDEMCALLLASGFATVESHPKWADLPLYDAEQWVVYVALR